MVWTMPSHENKLTAFQHQYFITKWGVFISCLNFSLSRQAGLFRLTRCKERGLTVLCVLPFIIATSGHSYLKHCDEQGIPISHIPFFISRRAGIPVSHATTSGAFPSRASWFYHRDEREFPVSHAATCGMFSSRASFSRRARFFVSHAATSRAFSSRVSWFFTWLGFVISNSTNDIAARMPMSSSCCPSHESRSKEPMTLI